MDTAGTRASEHGWLRRLAGYCWRYRRTVLVALAGALAATVATAAIPLVQRQIIDNVIVTHRASIWPLAGLLVIAAAVNFGGIYLRRYRGGRLSLDVQHDLRTELFDALSRLDGARQDEIHTGQLVGRSISDLNMVQGILSMVPITLGNLVLFVLSIGIMVVLSPVLTLVTVRSRPRCGSSRSRRGASCSRRAGTRSSSPARSPAWWTRPSAGCGWSRGSARRSRSRSGWKRRAGTCSRPGCG